MNLGRLFNGLMCLFPISMPGFFQKEACAGAAEAPRPNIVLIMVDDMGFSDVGCYGGEIDTPNIDALAAAGLRYTHFYNTGRCCPTRASLMTGLYAHQAGMGWMTRVDMRRPAYRGQLAEATNTLAEVLGRAGYVTHMTGKWHLVLDENMRPEGAKESWPRQRGFDQYFGTLSGGGGYFRPEHLVRENRHVRPSGNFYHTTAMTSDAVRFINKHARKGKGKPFFSYVAYYAPHRPLHALPEDIEKYKGRYDVGWEQVRAERYRRMKEMGLIGPEWGLSDRDAPAWDGLSDKEKDNMRRRMEVYAAQIDCVDQGVGEIVAALKATGQYENTAIFFLSDNGACAEVQGSRDVEADLGAAGSAQSYRKPWANVSNTPLRLYKSTNHEGGVATPLIVHWPKSITRDLGGFRRQVGHVIDMMPTFAELAGAGYRAERNGLAVPPAEGRSLVPSFYENTDESRTIFFEHESACAVISGRYKLVSVRGPARRWELYDLRRDRSELNDLRAENPTKADELAKLWEEWAARVGALPLEYMGWGERIKVYDPASLNQEDR